MMVSFFLVFLRLTTTTLSAGGIQGIKDASVTKNITLEFRTRPEKRNHHKSSTITSPFYLSPKKTKKNKKKNPTKLLSSKILTLFHLSLQPFVFCSQRPFLSYRDRERVPDRMRAHSRVCV